MWHILGNGSFDLTLANAAHVKNVPGRKTDANDATWLADLLAPGRMQASATAIAVVASQFVRRIGTSSKTSERLVPGPLPACVAL